MGESFIIVNLIEENPLSFIKEESYPDVRGCKLRLKLFAGPSNGEVL